MSIDFITARTKDLKQIAILAKENGLLLNDLNETKFTNLINWLYFKAPQKGSFQIIAKEAEKIIAHFGGTSFNFKYKNYSFNAIFASNIVIDKEAKKKALFFPLQKRYEKECVDLKSDFIYGINTRPDALKAHLASGWKNVGELNVYAKPINFIAIFNYYINNKIINFTLKFFFIFLENIFLFFTKNQIDTNDIGISRINTFDDNFTPFLNKWLKTQFLIAKRSVRILNWRFSSLEDRNYIIFKALRKNKICGYIVMREMRMKNFSSLAIVDFVCDKNDLSTKNALLNCANLTAKELEVDLIAVVFTKYSNLKPFFVNNGFFKSPEKFSVIVKDFPYSKTNFVKDFNKWNLSWFDHDYV